MKELPKILPDMLPKDKIKAFLDVIDDDETLERIYNYIEQLTIYN